MLNIVHVKCHSEMHRNVAFNKLDPENIYFNTFNCNWLKVKMFEPKMIIFDLKLTFYDPELAIFYSNYRPLSEDI